MSRAAFLGLGAAAAGLVGVLALELSRVEGDAVTSGASAAAVARWRPAPAVPTPPALDRTGEWAATALARPLFAPDRKPVLEPRGAAIAGAPGLPRLAGVLVTPAGGAAIFAAASEGAKPQVVRVGDRVGGFEVTAILAGAVTLTGPEGARVIRPSYDPRPAPPRPANPPVPAGFVPAAAPGGAPVPLPQGFPATVPGR